MLGRAAARGGYELVADARQADVIVVNTCAFIDRAKQESVDTILEMAREKEAGRARRLVVTGCLSQRYDAELRREIPEIDATLGTGPGGRHPARGRRARPPPPTPRRRAHLGLRPHHARACSPRRRLHGLREDQRGLRLHLLLLHHPHAARQDTAAATSRTSSREVRALAAQGVREIVLVAQDSTRYGLDHGMRDGLAYLLRRLGRIDGIRWIRVMYAYPATLSDGILDAIAGEEKVVKYVDIPLQHASEAVLKRMKRPTGRGNLHGHGRPHPRARARRGHPHVVHRRLPGRDGGGVRRAAGVRRGREFDHVGRVHLLRRGGHDVLRPARTGCPRPSRSAASGS